RILRVGLRAMLYTCARRAKSARANVGISQEFVNVTLRKFRAEQYWDSPHNIQLLDQMPRLFGSPGQKPPAANMTFYRVFVGPGTAFERDGIKIPIDFPDGCANTILVVEAGDAVLWTKLDEITYAPNHPLPELGGMFLTHNWLGRPGPSRGFTAAFADASIRWFPRSTPEATIRAYITRNGGEKIEGP
ncbi:MAG TPA: hypothetical protein VKS79_10870, partial [Gemmataceae bacterium]|nr:hypothetical protein [Gemmataceae bacterium]